MPAIAIRRGEAKALGAFYTPATIADMLAEWIVCNGSERLLEPSVGDGALISAVLQRARNLVGTDSKLRFLACDVDAAAIAAVKSSLPNGCEIRSVDFLQLDPSSTGKFSGVIANPPFTRNHALEPRRRATLRQKFEVSGAAGLWVHFLLHSLEFIAPGGKLAAIVPSAALFTNYGRAALERVCANFSQVELRQIIDKPLWVHGAEERGAIILATGFGAGRSAVPQATRWLTTGRREEAGASTVPAFDTLGAAATPLGDIAKLAIGAVTGCNAVFLMSESERRDFGIEHSDVRSVVARSRHLSGIAVDQHDLADFARAGEKAWLLAPKALGKRGKGVRRRLAQISKDRRRETVWLNKRDPWWEVDIGEPCDAIFTYMNDRGPKLVLADTGVWCTNTLHRVTFNATCPFEQRLAAALTMISTFGQLAAERIGRSYGGGVLKFELMEARRMPVLPPSNTCLETAFAIADMALRTGDRRAAQVAADEALIAPLLGHNWHIAVEQMTAELVHLRSARHGQAR